MNRKQYFAVSWFFLALAIFLIYSHTTFFLSMQDIVNSGSLTSYGVYYNTKWAIVASMILISFPLFALFQILGWLSPKEEEEDPILISYVKDKTKLGGDPKTEKDLYELAKTLSKKFEVTNAINEYYKSGKKHTEDMALLYSIHIGAKVGLKKAPKNPSHLLELAKKEGKLKEVLKELDEFAKEKNDEKRKK